MRARLKQFALLGLLACDGLPMPQSALVAYLQNSTRPKSAPVAECESVLGELEAQHWIAAVADELSGEKSWTLTEKGQHKAQQL